MTELPSTILTHQNLLNKMTEAQKNYNWIKRIIDSIENDYQKECVDKLIKLFYQKHDDLSLTDLLFSQLDNHKNFTH